MLFCILSLSMTKVSILNIHSIIALLCINLLSFWFFNLKVENLIDVAHLNVKFLLDWNHCLYSIMNALFKDRGKNVNNFPKTIEYLSCIYTCHYNDQV